MIRRFYKLASLVIVVTIISGFLRTTVAHAAEPTLVRAELITHTDGDNKDHDTGIFATVTSQDGRRLLAQILNADSSGTDATEYNDDSVQIVRLVVEDDQVTKSDSDGFKVRLAIQTNGHDTWKFDAQVILYFSDGTNLFAERRNISLVNNRAQVAFAAGNQVATSTLVEPTLVAAELITHTDGDNKDHDTTIFATVTTKDETSLLAQVLNADSSGTNATEYNDESVHTVKLVAESVGANESDSDGFKVRLAIQTNGHDTWKFDAQVILYFSDGTDLFAERQNISLVNDHAEVVFSAPTVGVAGFGHVHVTGFGLGRVNGNCWLRHNGSCVSVPGHTPKK